ncbi:NB-ARC_domain-containing protein [Hexamita inflata]|uniref:NB-ARC domain-containing protein n=2 Tax=Hexamita inflata TaxID=28002 RepID=A0AA86N6A2_9EUKA|nr:NB-ARC domain-containing protein [Hexamita inflata]
MGCGPQATLSPDIQPAPAPQPVSEQSQPQPQVQPQLQQVDTSAEVQSLINMLLDPHSDLFKNYIDFKTLENIQRTLSLSPSHIKQLFSIINNSKTNLSLSFSASNSISILNFFHFPFNNLDFSNVHIPCANLSGSICEGANFSNADLSGVNFTNSVLNGSKFDGANMKNVEFNERASVFCGEVNVICFNSKGQLATGDCKGVIKIWDVQSSDLIRTITDHASQVNCLQFNQQNELISGSNDCQALVHNARGELVQTIDQHTHYVTCAQFGQDLIATASMDKTVKIFEKGEQIHNLVHPGPVTSISFSKDGEILATACGTVVKFFDAKTGKVLHQIESDTDVNQVAFGSQNIVLSSKNQIQIYNARTFQNPNLKVLKNPVGIISSTQIQDDIIAASSDDKTLIIANTNGKLISMSQQEHQIVNVCFGPNQVIACADVKGNIKFTNIQQPKNIKQDITHTEKIQCINCNDNYLVSASYDMILIHSLSNGQILGLIYPEAHIHVSRIGINGETIVCDADNEIYCYNFKGDVVDKVTAEMSAKRQVEKAGLSVKCDYNKIIVQKGENTVWIAGKTLQLKGIEFNEVQYLSNENRTLMEQRAE